MHSSQVAAGLKPSLPRSKILLFALGQLGWSLASWAVSNALSAFFMPPGDGGSSLFPVFIFQGAVLGVATVIGLVNMGGRVWDAITDPLIANLSDRNRSRFGRRRLFLAIAAVPTALFGFLVFMPLLPGVTPGGQLVNSLWLLFTITGFYWFITMYCTPYNALIAEFGHSPKERLALSTAISVTWALGFVIGNMVWSLASVTQKTFLPDSGPEGYARSFQMVLGLFCFISAILMLLPVLGIDEKRYAQVQPASLNLRSSLRSVLGNRQFRIFLASDLPYWIAMTFIQQGLLYFFKVLLDLDVAFVSTAAVIMFFLSYVFYAPVVAASRRFGKRLVILTGFGVFALTFTVSFCLGWLPLPAVAQALVVVCLAALPLAIFGILPNAVIGDIADAHGRLTGEYQGAMFYGARTFMMKLGISVANLLFPSLLLLGRSQTNPWGVRLTAASALLFCLVGFIVFIRYNEMEIMDTLTD